MGRVVRSTRNGRVILPLVFAMPMLLRRLAGLLLLMFAILVPGCQALLQIGSSVNAPQQLSPGSFQRGR